jgi:hypothetical protein
VETGERDDRGEGSGDPVAGHRIGHLVAVKVIKDGSGIPRRVLFRCDCGRLVRIGLTKIRRKKHRDACKNCWKPNPRPRGRPRTKRATCRSHPSEYWTWRSIRQRARGKWRVSFEKFLLDMGPRPFKGATLLRHNDREPFYPSNCFWGNHAEKMMTRPLYHKGEPRTPGWVVRTFGIRRSFVTAMRQRGVTDVDEMLAAWKLQQSQEYDKSDRGG